MNADLEMALNGPGADLRALVASLRAAAQARVRGGFAANVMAAVEADARRSPFRGLFRPPVLFPLAACLVAVLAFAALFLCPARGSSRDALVSCQRADGSFSSSTAAPYVQAFAVTVLANGSAANRAALEQAVGALLRTQNEEGGWANARLSAQNVAALAAAAKAGVGMAVPAYRRGRRYLRMHGIGEMTAKDVAREARQAAGRLSGADAGLVCSVTLAARL